MNRSGSFSLAISVALISLGCGTHSSSSSSADSKESNAREKIGDAVNATNEAIRAKRDEFALEMGTRLDELNAKYEDLKTCVGKSEGQARKNLEQRLEEAKVKRDAAVKKLQELKEASSDQWDKVKQGVGNAFDDLKRVFE